MQAGFPIVEITLTTAGALAAIRTARGVAGALVGAGTVRTATQARDAVTAGAQFLVSPSCDPEVAEIGVAAGIPYLPGALTPTEIEHALRAGAHAVKIFPARVVGPQYLRDLGQPIPGLRAVASGGIDADNAMSYLAAGAWAVCPGGSVVRASAIEQGDHPAVRSALEAFREALQPSAIPL
jgi:2-dehydro-3-deoxyphosphogluconate aldolase/(4S)-4-hydroxy-2-oxoglutarate aldolase